MVEEEYAAFLQDNLSAVIVAAAVFGALADRRKGKCRTGAGTARHRGGLSGNSAQR
ncbi:hypothetical protein [Treponema endosymbiont of Eucomonympha sp.]|uniref:hypothetical protein n=1 Tax=Treponema endosymbiont of Eucomonympha sp. TaxID=1580831 RepID=UPI000A76ED4F|nr:hypothetical protein [Treponema endosymbiont of Eucomonympha sp.]